MSSPEHPDQYYSEEYIATSSVGRVGIDFGFVANQVVFVNDKNLPATTVFVSLDSSTGSTDGYALKASETLSLQGRIGGCALATTATSTADAIRIGAWRF